MRRRRLIWWVVLVAVLGLMAGACSDDDGGDSAQDTSGDTAGDDAQDTSGDTAGDQGEAGGGDCAALDATGATPAGEFTASTAYAVPMEDGAAWTVYLADFELDPGTITAYSSPTVPADGTLFMVSVTVFNAEGDVEPIEPPATIEYTDEFGVLTFTTMATVGTEQFGNNMGAEGTVELTAVGDTLCGTVDYADDEKSITGSFQAEAVDVGL